MRIYVDSEYKCHVANDGTMLEVETDFFSGKCNKFIGGYRFVPAGETWVREDGTEFHGQMVAPWRDYNTLMELQAQYEEMLAQQSDMRAALDTIYGGDTDDGT